MCRDEVWSCLLCGGLEFDPCHSEKSGMILALFLGPKVKICGSPFNKTQRLPELQRALSRESLAINYFAHFWSNSKRSGLLIIDCFHVRLEDIRRANLS